VCVSHLDIGSLATAGTWRADVLVRTAAVNEYRTLRFTFTAGPRAGFLQPGQAPERVTLQVTPGRLGVPNTVTVGGLPARGVQLISESLDMRMGRIPYAATPLGGGRWQARNVYPLMNGRWALTVQVRSGGGWVALRRFVYQVPLRGTMRLLGAGRAPTTATGTTIAPSAVRWGGLPDQAVVSFANNGLVYVPGLPTLVHVGSQNHSVKLVPDGMIWVMDNAGGRVAVLDPRTGRIVARIRVGIAPAHAAFTPDGRRVYVSNMLSNDVSVIDVHARRVVATVSVQPALQPHALAITPDGRQVWVPCGLGGGIWVIDTRTNKVTRQIMTGGFPHSVTFSPDGRTVYMTDATPGASRLFVLDRTTGAIRARIPIGTGSAMVVASGDGRRVYVTGQSGSVLTVIDAATRRVVTRVPVGRGPHGLAFTPDGRLLYVAVNDAHHVAVVDTTTDQVVATVPLPGTADELALWPPAHVRGR
jgi:YVTN family beta-propeller protein